MAGFVPSPSTGVWAKKDLSDFSVYPYKSVDGTATNSFRRPRQKIWGVFVRDPNSTGWLLVDITNDFRYGKLKVQEFLKHPPASFASNGISGINCVILCEVVQVGS